MTDDYMDLGNGLIPVMGGKYFLQRSTGKIFEIDRDAKRLIEVEMPDDISRLDDWPDDEQDR